MRVWKVVLSVALSLGFFASPAQAACEHPWIFFDLGNTLIDQERPGGWGYYPAAESYLRDLKGKHYRLGLIVNIPGGWGETHEERLASLKNAIVSNWTPEEAAAFDWSLIEQTLVFLPASANERKPAPQLFDRAMALAQDDGCNALFQGETPAEIRAAEASGMRGYLIGQKGRSFYLPEEEIGPGLAR